MDNFMDKLVEKINAQGATRSQNIANTMSGTHTQETAGRTTTRVSDEKLAEGISQKVTEALKDSNARYVELLTEYKKENDENYGKLKEELKEELSDYVHKESVKCYRNTQAAMEETVEKKNEVLSEKLDERISEKLDEKLKSIKSLKGILITAIVLGSCNLAMLVAVLLRLFGIL